MGELSQWLCRDDSTINITLGILLLLLSDNHAYLQRLYITHRQTDRQTDRHTDAFAVKSNILNSWTICEVPPISRLKRCNGLDQLPRWLIGYKAQTCQTIIAVQC